MTERDELSRLARAITEAEDAMNESNHRDDCQQLAQMDAERNALIERIDARERELEAARVDLLAYVTTPQSPAPDPTIWHVAEPVYSNGLDAHQED